MKYLISFFIFLSPFLVHANEPFSKLSAQQIFVKDLNSGQILYQKNADQRMPTSSMSKVMTAYMVFDAIENGKINLNDELKVSEKAWKKGGSKMFVEVGDMVNVEDLLKGVIVQSGNDATIVLAEGLAGTEKQFAWAMTQKAKELGMANSNFVNASGWPDKEHYSTASDLSLLAEKIISEFPNFYRYYSIEEFEYAGIKQNNRNPLLFRDDINVDGIKTGHTEVGGYGLMASGVDKDRRVILVMNGMESAKARAVETGRVMAWALNRFDNEVLARNTDPMVNVPVVYGKKASVAVSTKSDFIVSVPKGEASDIQIHFSHPKELLAPIKAGDVIGTIKVTNGNSVLKEEELIAIETVTKTNVFLRFFDNMGYRLGLK